MYQKCMSFTRRYGGWGVSIERGEVLQAVSMLQMRYGMVSKLQMQGKIQALLAPRGICATGGPLLLHKHNTVAKTYCQVHTLCCIIA